MPTSILIKRLCRSEQAEDGFEWEGGGQTGTLFSGWLHHCPGSDDASTNVEEEQLVLPKRNSDHDYLVRYQIFITCQDCGAEAEFREKEYDE